MGTTGRTLLLGFAFALGGCGGGGGGGGGDPAPPPPQPVAPTEPSGFTATPTTSQITLAWTDTSGNETGFDVERAPDVAGSPGTWSALPGSPLAADATVVSDTTLTLLADYWYRVRAFNAVGPSNWVQSGPVATLPPSGELIPAFGSGGIVTDDTDYRINDMASDGTYLYTAGYLNVTDMAWRVEKRDATTGALVSSFDGDGVVDSNLGGSGTMEVCRAIVIDGAHLYVGGIGGTQWRIEKRSLSTGALDTSFDGDGIVSVGTSVTASVSVNGVYGLAHDGTWLYAAGTMGGATWTIEKRNPATGALDPNFGTSGTVSQFQGSQLRTMVRSGSNLFVGGRGTNGWVLQKRLTSTGAMDGGFGSSGEVALNLTFPAKPEALAVDGSSLYVAGQNNDGWRIEKRNLSDGALDTGFDGDGFIEFDPSVSGADQPWGIAVDGADLLVTGTDYEPGDGQWRTEKRSSSTGELITVFGGGSGFVLSNPSGSTDSPKPIVLGAESVTIGGFQSASGATGVRIEKRTR